jgi:hypothetical protein
MKRPQRYESCGSLNLTTKHPRTGLMKLDVEPVNSDSGQLLEGVNETVTKLV